MDMDSSSRPRRRRVHLRLIADQATATALPWALAADRLAARVPCGANKAVEEGMGAAGSSPASSDPWTFFWAMMACACVPVLQQFGPMGHVVVVRGNR
jgi:hypothetical protein